MPGQKRKTGVLMHVSSLWGERSCGSFGVEAREFVDFLHESGFTCWQTLPFCLPNDFASPYSSFSAFSVNPYFIDLRALYDVGLFTREEYESALQRDPYRCEFERLRAERFDLLALAAERFTFGSETDGFYLSHPHTEKFCRFMSLRAANGNKPFTQWETEAGDERVYRTWRFICYVFVRQWKEIKKYANEKGISVIGDIPIYVSLDSSDVWEAPEQFLLDARKKPTLVAGVPPDYFSADGQLWGNPLYNWDVMRADGFRWWRDRISFMCEFFDTVRIDHFRGLESFYACKPDAENAREGVWMKGPGMELINSLKTVCGEGRLIAEDLGVITPAVRALVDESGFPGMRVMQFGFDGDPENTHIPYNYGKNTVAYTGTHDNNTLLGFIWELDGESRRRVLEYCGYCSDNWDRRESYLAIIRTLLGSVADTVILPMQDVLLYGSDTRMNTPGVDSGNWAWRATREQAAGIDRAFWKHLNTMYGRYLPEKKSETEEAAE